MQNFTSDDINYSKPLPKADFEEAMKKYDISRQLLLSCCLVAPARHLPAEINDQLMPSRSQSHLQSAAVKSHYRSHQQDMQLDLWS